jgi:tRNA (cmo5U34)-methyltransferase
VSGNAVRAECGSAELPICAQTRRTERRAKTPLAAERWPAPNGTSGITAAGYGRKRVGDQFHFHPEAYPELVRSEVPAYDRLQDVVARATSGAGAGSILDLGVGTGVTSQRVLAEHPGARLVGVDESSAMLDHACRALPVADLRTARLEDPLPQGLYDLVVSVLAVHHLDGPGKADLFRRVASVVVPGGRMVIGDVVVPDDPADAVTPIDGEYDKPSSAAEQLWWLCEAGFRARIAWAEADPAVLVGDHGST